MHHLLIVLTLVLLASEVFADDDRLDRPDMAGPLGIRSEAVLLNNGLAWTPGRLHTLPRGKVEYALHINHVNLWGFDDTYFVDMERTRYSNHIRVGLEHNVEISVEIPLIWQGGGILDGGIEWFHGTFGFTALRRPDHPQNNIRFDAKGVEHLTKADTGFGFGNPVIGIKKELFAIAPLLNLPNIALEALLKLPIGDLKGNRATKGWDFLIDAQIQIPATSDLTLYATLGVLITTGQEVVLGIPTRAIQMFFFLGIEIWLERNVTFEFNYTLHDGVAQHEEFGALHKSAHEFALGFKWAVQEDVIIEFGIIENSVNDFNTPDFGVHLGLIFRVG